MAFKKDPFAYAKLKNEFNDAYDTYTQLGDGHILPGDQTAKYNQPDLTPTKPTFSATDEYSSLLSEYNKAAGLTSTPRQTTTGLSQTDIDSLTKRRQQAQVDLDTDTVANIDRQLQADRALKGKQTITDRVSDLTSAAMNQSGTAYVGAVRMSRDMIEDPGYDQRQIAQIEKALSTGKTSDGKPLTAAMRETLKASKEKYQESLNQKQSGNGKASKIISTVTGIKDLEKSSDTIAQTAEGFQKRGEQGLGDTAKMFTAAYMSMLQSSTDAVIGAATGTGMVPFVVRAFGGSAEDARRKGADLDQQFVYASAEAAKEYVTEKLFGLALPQRILGEAGAGGFDGVLESVIKKGTEKLAKTEGGRKVIGGILTWLSGGLTEGLEELIGSWVENNFINPNMRDFDPDVRTDEEKSSEMWNDFLVGAISGLMGVNNLFTYKGNGEVDVNKTTLDTTKERAKTDARVASEQEKYAQRMAAYQAARKMETNSDVVKAAATQSANEESVVMTDNAKALHDSGMDVRTAMEVSSVIEKIAVGETPSSSEIKKLDLSNDAVRAMLTEKTGITLNKGTALGTIKTVVRNRAAQIKANMEQSVQNQIETEDAQQAVMEAVTEQAQKSQAEAEAIKAEVVATKEARDADLNEKANQMIEAAVKVADAEREGEVFRFSGGEELTRQELVDAIKNNYRDKGSEITDQQARQIVDNAVKAGEITPVKGGKANENQTAVRQQETAGSRGDNRDAGGLSGQSVQNSSEQSGRVSGGSGKAEARGESGQRSDSRAGSTAEGTVQRSGKEKLGSVTTDAQQQRINDNRKVAASEAQRVRESVRDVKPTNVHGLEQPVKVLPKSQYTPGIQKAVNRSKKAGRTMRLLVGKMMTKAETGRLVSIGGASGPRRTTTLVRADSVRFTAEQNAGHESMHDAIRADKTLAGKLKTVVKSFMSAEDIGALMDRYFDTYSKYYTPDTLAAKCEEELLCDLGGGINRYGIENFDSVSQAVQEHMDKWDNEFDPSKAKDTESTSESYSASTEKSWDQQVDDLIKVGIYFAPDPNSENSLYVNEEPSAILQEVGLPDYPMCMQAQHVRDALKPKNSYAHQHGLTPEQIKALPDLLSKPAAIIDSGNIGSGIVVFTTEVDGDGSPIVATIRPDGTATIDGVKGPSNFITSAYGLDNAYGLLTWALNNNGILYWNSTTLPQVLAKSNQTVPPMIQGWVPANEVLQDYRDKHEDNRTRLFSADEDSDYAPTFRSKMADVIRGMKENKMNASHVEGFLTKNGVKKDEIEWSGIRDFLSGKKNVTKEDLLEFAESSLLGIEEEVLGRETGDTSEQRRLAADLIYAGTGRTVNIANSSDLMAFIDAYGPELSNNDYFDLYNLHDEMRDIEYGKALGADPRWGEYKLAGGENYRELLFKMPGSTYSNNSMQVHWGQKGVLAHARVQDFPNSSAGRMLFTEEIQSDWHNAGQKSGYADESNAEENRRKLAEADRKVGEAANKYRTSSIVYSNAKRALDRFYESAEWTDLIDGVSKGNIDPQNLTAEQQSLSATSVKLYTELENARQAREDADTELSQAESEYRAIKNVETAPDAPFKKNYTDFVLKRLIRMAAEGGYDSIGWTTSEQQSERWSEDYAEGYRIEYDQDIPKFLNKYGKKWGAKVGTAFTNEYAEADYGKPSAESVLDEFMSDNNERLTGVTTEYDGEVYRVAFKESGVRAEGPSASTILSLIEDETGLEFDYAGKPDPKNPNYQVWSFPITDSMKQSVLYEGQEMYSAEEENDNEYSDSESLYGRASDNPGERTPGVSEAERGTEAGNGRGLGSENALAGQVQKVNSWAEAFTLLSQTERDTGLAFSLPPGNPFDEGMDLYGPGNKFIKSYDETKAGLEEFKKDFPKYLAADNTPKGTAKKINGQSYTAIDKTDYEPDMKKAERDAKKYGYELDYSLDPVDSDGVAGQCSHAENKVVVTWDRSPAVRRERVNHELFHMRAGTDGYLVNWITEKLYERGLGDVFDDLHDEFSRRWESAYKEVARSETEYKTLIQEEVLAEAYANSSAIRGKNRAIVAEVRSLVKAWERGEIYDVTDNDTVDGYADYEAYTVDEDGNTHTAEEVQNLISTLEAMYGEGSATEMFETFDQLDRAAKRAAEYAADEQANAMVAEWTAQAEQEAAVLAEREKQKAKRKESNKRMQNKLDAQKEADAQKLKLAMEQARIEKAAAVETAYAKATEKSDAKIKRMKEAAAKRLKVEKSKAQLGGEMGQGREMAAENSNVKDKLAREQAARKEDHQLASKSAKDAADVIKKYQKGDTEELSNKPVSDVANLLTQDSSAAAKKTMQDRIDALKTKGRSLYKTFVSGTLGIESFSRAQRKAGAVGGLDAGVLLTEQAVSNSSVQTILHKYLVDKAGNEIGASLDDTVICWKGKGKKRTIDTAKQDVLQAYMMWRHTIDRMSLRDNARAKVEAYEANHPWLRDMDSREFALLVAQENKAAVEYKKLLQNYRDAKNKAVLVDSQGKAYSADTAREMVAKFEAEQSWVKEKAEGIYSWWDTFMKEWAVGDYLTQDMYDLFQEMYKSYVPTYRTGKKGSGTVSSAGDNVHTSSLLKQATGGTSDIKLIQDSYADLVSKWVKNSRTQALLQNIVDTAMLDETGEFNGFAVFDWDATSKKFKTSHASESQGGLEVTTDQQHVEALSDEGNGIYRVSAWSNGERVSAIVSKDLYDALNFALNPKTNDFQKMGAKITAPMKTAITGINPWFGKRNVVRDFPTAVINSISGIRYPKYWMQAWKEVGKTEDGGSENWKHFVALGGTSMGYYNNEGGYNQYLRAMARQSKNPIRKVGSALGYFNEMTESVSRFAEYLATIDRLPGGDTYENRLQGIKNAAEVTVDFSRKGTAGGTINAWVPYWNPAVQGIDKVIRSVVEDRSLKQAVGTVSKAALVTIPFEILLRAAVKGLGRDKEYDELADRTKDTYYCIPASIFPRELVEKIGVDYESGFIKIPRNREWGALFGASTQRILEAMDGRADPFENYYTTSIKPNFLPESIFSYDPIEGVAESGIIGIGTALELAQNQDFAGRKIIPASMKSAYNTTSPGVQADGDTSVYAKELAKVGNAVTKYVSGKDMFSPMAIDYILSSYFGDFANLFQSILSQDSVDRIKASQDGEVGAVGSAFALAKEAGKAVGSSTLKQEFTDSRFSNQLMSDYYEMLSDVSTAVSDLSVTDPENYKDSPMYKLNAAFNATNGLTSQISELSKQIRNTTDKAEQGELKEQMIELAAQVMEMYDAVQSGEMTEPKLVQDYSKFSPKLSKELIKLDELSGEFAFKPSANKPSSYTDPEDNTKEYKLDKPAKDKYGEIYAEQYDSVMTEAVKSNEYRNLSDSKEKAEYLEAARDAVASQTKEEFMEWLTKNYKSTKKKGK